MNSIVPLNEAADANLVGGKAASLGKLIRAGFPVPDGFVILPDTDCETCVLDAYATLGGGTVAVRSSATAEDGATHSMAGQFETILNVSGDAALLAAVKHCRASVISDRVRAYAAGRDINPADVRMAVVVQRQVQADAAGVLFTAAPDDAFPRQMLIEAAWGLGESVVSGRVQPDILRLAFKDGVVVSKKIATKRVEYSRDGERAVAADRQDVACLADETVSALWQLGRRAEAHFGRPQDLEWAIAAGRLYLLQSRPITTHADAAEAEDVVVEARETVEALRAAGHGPWVVHNLAETLPNPTPLAWSVIRRFMSADGGYGHAYRASGFEPTGEFLDLIGGRIYMDAARAPNMFAADFPYAYDANVLRRSPDASQQPPTLARRSAFARWRAGRLLRRVESTLGRTLPNPNAAGVLSDFVRAQKRVDLATLTPHELVLCWHSYESHVMDEFGSHEVMTGLQAGRALERLANVVARHVWDEDPAALAAFLSSAGPADSGMTADAALYDVGTGDGDLDGWLAQYGHRGMNEMDLAAPRWRERPEAAMSAAKKLAAGESPWERHRRHAEAVERRAAEIRTPLSPAEAHAFDLAVAVATHGVRAREAAKDTLILGYDLLRDVALEVGRRLHLDDRVFFLSREEMLDALRGGSAPTETAAKRKKRHAAASRLRWPAFIDAPETIGNTAPPATGAALAISAGEAIGVARVMRTPEDGTLLPGEVLVCPSTDPAWTPVLAAASGLVIEVGGTLSHGAIVARELGLPAVVLPDATRRFSTGDLVRVDGTLGTVNRVGENEPATDRADDPKLPAAMLPPPAGAKDERAARLRNVAATLWAIYLLGFFLLPAAWVRGPTFGLFDGLLWRAAGRIGWPAVVATAAVITGTATLLLQRLLTNNYRLTVAKMRADRLRKEAAALPAGSPRQAAMLRAAAGVPVRVLGASLVPVGLLLGPMVTGFVWLEARAPVAAWNAPAGSAVRVVATVDGEWSGPVTLSTTSGVDVDATTPVTQTLPPLRPTLERLLAERRDPAADPNAAADLAAYLKNPIPDQSLTWLLRPGETFDGAFAVTADTDDGPPLSAVATVGNARPRSTETASAIARSPVRSLRIVYPPSKVKQSFLNVLGVDVGWLGVYVAAYVVTLVVVRRLAKVA